MLPASAGREPREHLLREDGCAAVTDTTGFINKQLAQTNTWDIAGHTRLTLSICVHGESVAACKVQVHMNVRPHANKMSVGLLEVALRVWKQSALWRSKMSVGTCMRGPTKFAISSMISNKSEIATQ